MRKSYGSIKEMRRLKVEKRRMEEVVTVSESTRKRMWKSGRSVSKQSKTKEATAMPEISTQYDSQEIYRSVGIQCYGIN